jgi:formamidopyrimidine-DNA glycosylase
MPELPDVENFTRYLKRTALKKKIKGVEAQTKQLIQGVTFPNFRQALVGRKFSQAYRRAKYLIIELEGVDEKMVMHFGMTGYLRYRKQDAEKDREDRFAQVTFLFANGYELQWMSKRKLGRIYWVRDINDINALKEMGPEPFDLSEADFLELLAERANKNIKAFLMEQKDIAGIGNEYSDEILFHAGISPKRKTDDLNDKEKKTLFQNMRSVLEDAVRVGAPDGDFGPEWLLSHRSGDMLCPKNSRHKLVKETIAGRPSVYCPEHQH